MSPRRYESAARDAASEETRRRIVEAAGEIVAGPLGFAGMKLGAVAKAAGVTRLTIYNQFGTRRALLEAIFDERAERGGLKAIPEMMQTTDPHTAIERIIEIFCRFFAADPSGLARVWAASIADPDLAEGVKARSERRRFIFRALVGRLVEAGDVRAEAANDLVDLLYALTSMPFYSELALPGRGVDDVAAMLKATARDAIRRAGVSGQ